MDIRILIVDDDSSIHTSIEESLNVKTFNGSTSVNALRRELFSFVPEEKQFIEISYSFDNAYQAEDALIMIEEAYKKGNPYELVIIDSRMPPGMDGPTAIEKIFDKYEDIDIILLTAYTDMTWEKIQKKIKYKDQFVYIKKPFDINVLRQIVSMLTVTRVKVKKIKGLLNEMSKDLEKRTRELNYTVEDYIKVEEKRKKALSIKHEFISTISHELKTPLTAAISVMKAFDRTELSDVQKSYVKILNETHEILLHILDNILDFSRLENDSLELHDVEFQYKKLVEMNVVQMMQSAKDKGNEINLQIDDRIPDNLYGDPGKIRQIYSNLIGNAIKFTDNGKIDVGLELLNDDDETVTVLTTIVDTGVGIKSSQYKKIFGHFSQADSSIQRRFGGSGIGLNVSKKLVEKMGGEIGVVSKVGEGSNFTFHIVLKKFKSAINS